MESTKLKEQVNRSGFPLQIAIEHAVLNTHEQHSWQIYSKEHSWKNDGTGDGGFIDLILIDYHRTSLMVIDCKRVQNSHWIFLNPSEEIKNVGNAKTWISYNEGREEKFFGWADIILNPISIESGFCVVPGQDQKTKPMLERIAADLTEATENFALEDKNILFQERGELRLYCNVIVTTAELKVCDFSPGSISLHDGTLGDAEFKTVPYLRFRKQLSIDGEPKEFKVYQNSFFKGKENTVFVVNSESFIKFLIDYEADSRSVTRVLSTIR